ncbi:MAG: hypothetical protein JWP82_1387 [Humibacillus sp.]|nr:hypothetical protein [Humibacillus sp.]
MADQSWTVIVGVAGLVVGWLVGGYQRITEKLIEERRGALAELLAAADTRQAGEALTGIELTTAVARAELLCSPQMARSGLIPALAESVSTTAFHEVRARFLEAARADGSTISVFLRALWWGRHRRALAPDRSPTARHRPERE